MLTSRGCFGDKWVNCNRTSFCEIGWWFEAWLNEHKKVNEKLAASEGNFILEQRIEAICKQRVQVSHSKPFNSTINHIIIWKDVRVLTTETDEGACHIKESIWLVRKAINTMNRDEGVHVQCTPTHSSTISLQSTL